MAGRHSDRKLEIAYLNVSIGNAAQAYTRAAFLLRLAYKRKALSVGASSAFLNFGRMQTRNEMKQKKKKVVMRFAVIN